MEGVDYLYSTTEQGTVLGTSLLAVHYYHKATQYPVAFTFYRRKEELEQWGKLNEFKEKNELARELFASVLAMRNTPSTWLMDSYFMTKENARALKILKKDYVSRRSAAGSAPTSGSTTRLASCSMPSRAGTSSSRWSKTPRRVRPVLPRGHARRFHPGHRLDLVVLVPCGSVIEAEDAIEEPAEEFEAPSKRKFRVFVTNRRDWDASTVLSIVLTALDDRDVFPRPESALGRARVQVAGAGRTILLYCPGIPLLLVYYLGTARGLLDRYGAMLGSLGQAREAFTNYCQEQFGTWSRRHQAKV